MICQPESLIIAFIINKYHTQLLKINMHYEGKI